jgi:hypothetical protein
MGCCLVFSETEITLSGKVVNKNTDPIEGVIVTLIRKQMSDTTGADGKFIISAQPAPIRSRIPVSSRQPTALSTVSLFSLRGQLIGNVNRFPDNRILQKNGLPVKPSPGVYLLRYDNLTQSPVARCLLEPSESPTFSFPDALQPKSLLKQSAVDDSLNFTKKGYVSKRMKITSYIDTLGTIKLDTALASFPIRKPQSYDKVMEYEPSYFYAQKIWDADYVCDCQKTELKADIYIQVSPVAQDTFFNPSWQIKYYRVVNAWILKESILQTLDSAGYDPGGNHANDAVWFVYKGKYYRTSYSSMGFGARRCNAPDCLMIYAGPPPGAMITNGCARSACADRPSAPVSCVRVNADGTVPPFADPYEKGVLPCGGDELCR